MSYNGGQRVPAWKRLGLKLKGPASAESPAPATSANGTASVSAPTQQKPNPAAANAGIKRKQPPSNSVPASRGADKRQRTETVVPSPKKSVKFTEDTKEATDKLAPEPKKAPKKPKEKKKKAAKPAKDDTFNLEPALVYLRQWQSDRASWKFNKNSQTLVIKYFFDTGRIPAADVPIFLAYIRDLKGFVRTRLREEAAQIKKKDMADGAAAFSGVKEKLDKENKQGLYEEILSRFLQLGQQESESSTANGKRTFDEADFASEAMDVDVKERVVKRMRAELVLKELSESEESTTSAPSEDATTSRSSAAVVENKVAPTEPAISLEKKDKQADVAQPLKRRRLRKSRTADISDSSSSDSESDSDSDSSSDSSDDEEDEEMPLVNGAKTESSSSSSSSSASGSDSEDSSDSDSEDTESGNGAKVEQDGDEPSSDSDDSD